MYNSDNIFLIGPMGCGKTTIGRQLSKSLDKEFWDSDHEIERKTGAKIGLIFEIEGEEGFRRRESSMIAQLTSKSNIVLATGGGVILDDGNRRVLKSRGLVIYLRAPLDLLCERTARDRHRPLLNADDPRQVLAAIVLQREPYYLETADSVIDTNHRSVRQIVRKICAIVDHNGARAHPTRIKS